MAIEIGPGITSNDERTHSCVVTRIRCRSPRYLDPADLRAVADVAATTSFEPVTLSVTSDGTDEPVYQNATLTVPQGTEKVTLKYNVVSLEYPEWVQQQSPFDDVWSLWLYGGPGGQQLFETWRNVNSQQSGEPAWQGDSSTGEIEKEFDVTALAANGDVQLVMVASAVNIRDFHFDTTVNAELGGVAKLTIDSVEKDTVTPTKGDSKFVSIPRPDPATNHFERWFTLKVTKPKPEATITNVRVSLRSGAGATLQDLFEEGPGQNVTLENNGQTIKVRVTMHTVNSSVPSTPPPTHIIRFRFTVQAQVDAETQWSDPKDSEEMFALWRMPGPNIFARYGQPPDTGLDDWATRGAYDWLSRNVGLFAKTSINDISGEHARDIDHNQHERGVEIDIFHFKRFADAWNAASNYRLLRGYVVAALNDDQQAKGLVKDWVTETRSGFNAFLPLSDVEKLYTTVGTSYKVGGVEVLTDGWGEQLIMIRTTITATLHSTALSSPNEGADNVTRIRYGLLSLSADRPCARGGAVVECIPAHRVRRQAGRPMLGSTRSRHA